MKRISRSRAQNRHPRRRRGTDLVSRHLKFENLEARYLLAANILKPLDSEVGEIASPGDQYEFAVVAAGDGGQLLQPLVLAFVVTAADGSTLDPSAPQISAKAGNAIAPLVSVPDRDFGRSSLLLAKLPLDQHTEYSLLVSGDRGTTGAFQIDVFIPGDSNGDGNVDGLEVHQATAAVVQHLGSANFVTELFYRDLGIDLSVDQYRPEFDADQDGDVDGADLGLIEMNQNLPIVAIDIIPDNEAPAITTAMNPDTGWSSSDGVTKDVTAKIEGTVTDKSEIVAFSGRVDNADVGSFVDLMGQLDGQGSFSFDRAFLGTLDSAGTFVDDGPHTLYLYAKDELDNEHGGAGQPPIFQFTFEFDTQKPTVQNESTNTDEDTPATGNVLTNDTDPPVGGPVYVDTHDTTSAEGASVQINDDGSFTYDPTASTTLQQLTASSPSVDDTFSYTVTDVAGNTDTAITTVTVSGLNDAPILTSANPGMGTTDEDNGIDVTLNTFVTGITDADTGAVIGGIAITGSTGNGAWEYSMDGTNFNALPGVTDSTGLLLESDDVVRYTPDGENGESPAITYRGWDTTSGTVGQQVDTAGANNGGTTAFSSSTDMATLTVTSVNDAPILTPANPGMGTTDEDNGIDVTLNTFVTGITDADTGAVIGGIAITGSTGNGAWEYSMDGTNFNALPGVTDSTGLLLESDDVVRYTPDGENGESPTITYRAWDTTSGTVGQQVDTAGANNGGTTAFSSATDAATLTVTPVNDAPILTPANPGMGTTDEDNGIDVTLNTFVTGITDADTGAVIGGIAITGGTGNGMWQYSTDGTNFNTLPGVSDTSGLLLESDDVLRYTPDGENGESPTITYRAWDTTSGTVGQQVDTSGANNGGTTAFSSSTDMATLTVTSVNDAPTSADNTVTGITDNEEYKFKVADFPFSDVDTGDALVQVQITRLESVGALKLSGTDVKLNQVIPVTDITAGNLMFEWSTDAQGEPYDDFDFEVNDGTVYSVDNYTMTINVIPNQPPVAQDDDLTATQVTSDVEYQAPVGRLLQDNGNGVDSDPDNDPLSVKAETKTSVKNAAVTLNADGSFSYDGSSSNELQALALNETTTDTFTYTLQDGRGGEDGGSVTVTVVGVNDAPTVSDVPISASEDGPTVNGSFVGDDVDSDNNQATLGYSIQTQPSEGSVTNNSDGTFTFDPGDDFHDLIQDANREVKFTYQAMDRHNATSNIATVTVTVTGVNDAPTVEDVSISVSEDGPAMDDSFVGNDVDSDDDPTSLVYSIQAQPNEGSVTNNSDGTFTFDPGNDFHDLVEDANREVKFTYQAMDRHNATSNIATVTVTVTGVNDAPTVANGSISASEDGPNVPGSFAGDDADSDDSQTTLQYTLTQPSGGSVNDNNNGTFTFDPSGDFQDLAEGNTRQVTFTYQAMDQHSATSNIATVTVTVNGVNDAPVLDNSGEMTLTDIAEDDFNSAGDTIQSVLSSGGGDRITDLDTGAMEGIAVVGIDDTNGTWQYSTDGGGNWSDFGSPSESNARLLDPSSRVRFVPNADFDGGSSINFGAWDQSSGANGAIVDVSTNGGTTAFSAAQETASITVNSIGVEVHLVALDQPTGQGEVTSLPASVSSVTVGDTFFVEIWLQDFWSNSPGLQGARFDVNFGNTQAVTTATNLHWGEPFSFFNKGTIVDATAEVHGFGGSVTIPAPQGTGVSPNFARLGYVELTADAAGVQEFQLDLDDPNRQQDPTEAPSRVGMGSVPAGKIALGTVSVDQQVGVGEGESDGAATVTLAQQDPLDVNNDGVVTPLDVLVVINHLNRSDRNVSGGEGESSDLDVNGDGVVTPLDALSVINRLNLASSASAASSASTSGPAEGEWTADANLVTGDQVEKVDSTLTVDFTRLADKADSSVIDGDQGLEKLPRPDENEDLDLSWLAAEHTQSAIDDVFAEWA